MSDRVNAPQQIILHKVSRTLEMVFADRMSVILPAAWLREHSPSAENRHAPVSQATLKGIGILSVEPVGHYAVKLLFSDGHRSGIYSWETLRSLGERYQKAREE